MMHNTAARDRIDPARQQGPRIASVTYTQGEIPRGKAYAERLSGVDPWSWRPAERRERFQTLYRETWELLAEVFDFARSATVSGTAHQRLIRAGVRDLLDRTVPQILAAIAEDRTLLVMLAHTDAAATYLPRHAANVAILAARIGIALGFNDRQVRDLVCAAVLSDLGMSAMPEDLLAKPGALTPPERQVIQRHPAVGVDLLSGAGGVDRSVLHVVGQVHERLDGTGYPAGKRDVLIHNFARIIAVADTYDALKSDRPWRRAYLPYHAMVMTMKEVGAKRLDSTAGRALVEAVGLFPIGSFVRLADGRMGRVVDVNGVVYDRPTLRLIAKGRPFDDDPWVLDLTDPDQSAVKVDGPVAPSALPILVPALGGF